MRFALIAGELSGDILGAALIQALKSNYPDATFYGVAGPRMVAAGCEAIESIEALSLMGIAEVLPAIPRLMALRSRLIARFAADKPDVVIGIDAPDFNLGLERRLKQRGLKTVHLVSPTVWAWRQGRVKTIAQSVDLILCLFPFEPKFYANHGVRAEYIGHSLADDLLHTPDTAEAREKIGLSGEGPVVAILPGSRGGELKYLSEPFAQTAQWLHQRMPTLRFVTPVAKPSLKAGMQAVIAQHASSVPWTLLDGQSRVAMRAADVVLLASGTATLECLLIGRPMVVAYKGAALTAWLLRSGGLLKVQYASLPNLLSAEPRVPELMQEAAEPQWLGQEVLMLLRNPWWRERQLEQFDAVRNELKRNAAQRAADAITQLLSA